MIDIREIRHFHMCGAIGGGAQGFNMGTARIGNMVARARCIGSIDVDAAVNRDFETRIGRKATTLDLFDRGQYVAFHDHEPPPEWREATPEDIRRAAGGERPHIVFASYPCKGNSGLLSQVKSETAKYQALNALSLRGTWLMLEAWADDPPELVLFENVPRIATRSRHLLGQVTELLRHYGYAVAETTHDCGELAGLAQSRKRFLLVARHIEKVPPFLYEPPKRPLASVGSVLGRMPLPGDAAGGPMHRIPRLQWKTWVRLAFVEAGSDWRSLNRLAVEDGRLRDYLIVPEYHRGYLGVNRWKEPAGVIAGHSRATNGNFSIADPRFAASSKWHDGQAYGVLGWTDTSGAIAGQQNPGQGNYTVADPRMPPSDTRHYNMFRVIDWTKPSNCVTGSQQIGSGAMAVADPRQQGPCFGKYPVTPWDAPSGCIIGGSTTGQGAFAVADPRPAGIPEKGDHYLTGGHYGVVPWASPCGAVSGAACHDNGRWSVADPRLPAPADKLVAVIRALDDTWHRPFTTLELAALQGLVEPDEQMELDGLSDQSWRERIGNAVPPPAAAAIASEMYRTLLLAWSGETFQLSATPIWVRPVTIALSVAQGGV